MENIFESYFKLIKETEVSKDEVTEWLTYILILLSTTDEFSLLQLMWNKSK